LESEADSDNIILNSLVLFEIKISITKENHKRESRSSTTIFLFFE